MRKTLCLLLAVTLAFSPLGCKGTKTVFQNESSSPYASQILELVKKEESALVNKDEQGYISCFSSDLRSDPRFSSAVDYELEHPTEY
jgi:hypothetical protein